MKNFLKILGVISLALIIGFSVAACKKAEEEEEPTTTTTTTGSTTTPGVEWPADILAAGNTDSHRFRPNGAGQGVTFDVPRVNAISGDTVPSSLLLGSHALLNDDGSYTGGAFAGAQIFRLASVEGKTIKVTVKDTPRTLCTDYEISADNKDITLKGGDALFALISDPVVLKYWESNY